MYLKSVTVSTGTVYCSITTNTNTVPEINQVPIHQTFLTKEQGGLLLGVGDGGRGVRYKTFLPKSRSRSMGVDQWAYKSGWRAREEGRKGTGRGKKEHGKSGQRAREERDIVMGRDIMSISGEGVWAANFKGQEKYYETILYFFLSKS